MPKVIVSGWHLRAKWSLERVRLVKMAPPASAGRVAVAAPVLGTFASAVFAGPAAGAAAAGAAPVAVTTMICGVRVGAGVLVGDLCGYLGWDHSDHDCLYEYDGCGSGRGGGRVSRRNRTTTGQNKSQHQNDYFSHKCLLMVT